MGFIEADPERQFLKGFEVWINRNMVSVVACSVSAILLGRQIAESAAGGKVVRTTTDVLGFGRGAGEVGDVSERQ